MNVRDPSTSGGQKTVSLPERLTLQEASAALVRLSLELEGQAGPEVSVNASALTVLDSSAVAVLLELRRSMLARGKSLRLVDQPQRLRDLVILYGVGDLIPG